MWPKHVGKASSGEMPLYSEEAEADLIEESLKLAREKIDELKLSHHPCLHRQVIEDCMEEHEKRVDSIKLLFHQKRTGLPF